MRDTHCKVVATRSSVGAEKHRFDAVCANLIIGSPAIHALRAILQGEVVMHCGSTWCVFPLTGFALVEENQISALAPRSGCPLCRHTGPDDVGLAGLGVHPFPQEFVGERCVLIEGEATA